MAHDVDRAQHREHSSNQTVLELRRLTKYYGTARGVESVSLDVSRGEIFGLLGPNGAGKTTILRSLMGFLRPTDGEARLFDSRVTTDAAEHHDRVGYLPADLRLWPRLRVRTVSDLFLGLGASRTPHDRDELAKRLGITLDRRLKSLSLGNRQKVGLLLALQHRPELLILDEPTSGLDPLVRRDVLVLLRDFAARGGTVVYSSHNLEEVERICSRVGILRQGRLVALKTIDELREEREQRLEVVFAGETPAALPAELRGFERTVLEPGRWLVSFRGSPDPLLRWLAGLRIAELSSPSVTLEEAFLNFYRENADGQ